MQRYDPEKTDRSVIVVASPVKIRGCVTRVANSCLQENMINDSCSENLIFSLNFEAEQDFSVNLTWYCVSMMAKSAKSIANIMNMLGDDFDVFGKDDQSSLLDLLHGYLDDGSDDETLEPG